MHIRPLTLSDLDAVSAIHLRAFPESALTHLGHEAVRRYYEWQLTGPHDCYAIGAFTDDQLMLGFCFGGTFRGALSGFLDKNRRFLALRLLTRPWLVLTEPMFRDRLRFGISALRRYQAVSKQLSESSAAYPIAFKPLIQVPPRKSFGILAIAVDPATQSHEIGKALMLDAEAAARRKQMPQMHLSVAVENTNAIAFYEHIGWVRVKQNERWSGSMNKVL